jgi:predicted extracellular nuclease
MFAAPRRGFRYSISLAAVFAMVLAVLPFLPGTAQGAVPVFINEIHYDNAGTDVGEAIEVAGPAGTDLTGWSLVRYNGNGGAAYGTDALGGILADAGSGFGFVVVSFPVNGLQNGSPDGVALVNDGGAVVQFLSYEGSFTAVDGPAAGLTSVDIGVSEPNTTTIGHSLQLAGSGTVDSDFSWQAAAPSTFGSANNGQTFGDGGGPTILINEVDADQSGTDSAEFVELYDGGAGNTDLSGLSIVLYNGSDDASYLAFDLDGLSTDVDGYFVMCGNAATTANCDLDVAPDTNLIQNGADAVALVEGDAVDFPNDTPVSTAGLLDAIVYDTDDGDDAGLLVLLNAGQPQVNEAGRNNKDNHSNQRCPNGSGGARNTSTYSQYLPTPGEASVCEDPALEVFIHDIQGSGDASPLVGQTVVIEGIVVGDFQDDVGANGDLNGFHVQEEDADADADPLTSEGIFVFNGSNPSLDVAIGDLVRVEGPVSEFFGLTEITSFSDITILSSGNPLPTPASPMLPVADVTDFERFEGMSVDFAQSLVISEYFNYDRFGEIVLSSQRHLQPTAEFEPGSAEANAAADLIARDRITLDDGQPGQNPDFSRHPNGNAFSLDNRFRGGDTLTNVVGVMDFSFGNYKIQPTGPATYTAANPRPASPDDVGGDVTVASFNVLNYYTTIDESGAQCFPSFTRRDCRGADSADELARQRAKIVTAIAAIDADVVGLIEIENNVNDDAVIDLVNGINDAVGAGTYDYVAAGTTGTDTIKVAFIYKPAVVSLAGAHAILDDPSFLDPANTGIDRNRAALAQTFTENVTGESFTAVVNHFKSKSGSETDDPPDGICVDGDPGNDTLDCDQGDGQAFFNYTRTLAAQVLSDWLATDPTGSGDPDVLVIGDLNAYDKEDPIDAMAANGYTDLVGAFGGEAAYSYVFDGQIGYLDYGMANAALLPAVTGTTVWNLNADEPDILDYDTSFKSDNQDAIFDGTSPFRSSDHDPVIIGLNLANPMGDKAAVAANLAALLPTDDANTERRLNSAIVDVEASLNPAWWTSDQTITNAKVFDNERQAIAQLALVVADGGPEAADASDAIMVLLNADRQLAQIELIAAIARDGRASKIADAQAAMADAAAYAAAGMYVDAVNAYKAAWRAATSA